MRLAYLTRSVMMLIILLALFLSANTLLGAGKVVKSTDPEQRIKWYQEHVAMKERSIFKNISWQFLGPTNVSGRMTDVAVVAPFGKP